MRISTCSVSPVFLHLPALLCQHMAGSQPRGKGCACITSVIKLAVEFNCQHCLSGQLLLGQRESKGSLGQQCSGGSQQPPCMSTCMHERSRFLCRRCMQWGFSGLGFQHCCIWSFLGVCFALLILVLLAHLWEGEQGAGIRYLHF